MIAEALGIDLGEQSDSHRAELVRLLDNASVTYSISTGSGAWLIDGASKISSYRENRQHSDHECLKESYLFTIVRVVAV